MRRSHGQRMYLAAMAAQSNEPAGYIDEERIDNPVEDPEVEDTEVRTTTAAMRFSFVPVSASHTVARPSCLPWTTTSAIGKHIRKNTRYGNSNRVLNANLRWNLAMDSRLAMNSRLARRSDKDKKVKFNIPGV